MVSSTYKNSRSYRGLSEQKRGAADIGDVKYIKMDKKKFFAYK